MQTRKTKSVFKVSARRGSAMFYTLRAPKILLCFAPARLTFAALGISNHVG